MKKIVSLIAVALFATTFAAGCGKMTKCSEAKKEADCKADNFDKEKDDKGKCKWDPTGGTDKKGACVKDEPTTPSTPAAYTATKEDKDICAALSGADDNACKTAHDALAADKQISKAAKDANWLCKAGTGGKCELKQ